jgi:hypothetical protein
MLPSAATRLTDALKYRIRFSALEPGFTANTGLGREANVYLLFLGELHSSGARSLLEGDPSVMLFLPLDVSHHTVQSRPHPFGCSRSRRSCPFHEPFEIHQIIPCHSGERRRFDARAQPDCNLGPPIGKRLEQDETTRKNVRVCLPGNSPLRNTQHDLQNGLIFFAV